MKAISQFLLIALCIVLAPNVSGQRFLNKLGKKIMEKAETPSAEKTAGDSINNSATDTAGSESGTKPAGPGSLFKKLGMTSGPIAIEDTYTFDLAVHMLAENYHDGKKESERSFIYYFDQQVKNLAFEPISNSGKDQIQGRFIFDMKNNAMIMLADKDGKKTAVVMGQNLKQLAEPENLDDTDMQPAFSKTGRTKTIHGYKCDEYRYDDAREKTESFFWITPEVDFKIFGMGESPAKKNAYSRNMPAGFVMEYEITNKRNNDRSVMTVTNIEKNLSKLIDMTLYEVENMGAMMNEN